jgi:predicted dehydrogenase
VIIAVPPSAQYSIARDALKAGLHVLCEKPLAPSAAEARDLIAQARQAGRVLAVNNTRRLFPTSREIKRLLEAGALGDLRSISYFEGQPFEWPTASGFYFQAGVSPRGVLLDRGAHVLDLICWWLNAQPKVTRSHHDSFGGPEAVAHLELEHLDCRIDVRLSWLSQQANRFSIEGEKGRISGNIYDFQTFQLELADGRRQVRMPSRANVFADFGRLLIESFVAAIRGEAHQLVYGADVVDSIEVLDRCYEEGSRFALPWYDNLRTDASE